MMGRRISDRGAISELLSEASTAITVTSNRLKPLGSIKRVRRGRPDGATYTYEKQDKGQQH